MWLDVLLHGIPLRHSESAEPFVGVALVVVGVLVAVAAGVLIGRVAQARAPALAAAFAVGALLFLFYDLLKEAAGLGQGLVARPLLQVALVAAFAVGALAIPLLARPGARVRLAYLWAVGISAHGAGEAWIVGTEAAHADITAPLQAASFLIHKVVEAFTIPLVAGIVLAPRHAAGVAALMGGVALAAALAGLYLGPGVAPLFLFAVGAGATAHALLRLAAALPPDARHAAAAVAGVVLVYAAGVLHEL